MTLSPPAPKKGRGDNPPHTHTQEAPRDAHQREEADKRTIFDDWLRGGHGGAHWARAVVPDEVGIRSSNRCQQHTRYAHHRR
eukprot:COSAG02_NODE_1104_length_14560_cov_5.927322_13_plen_82_part_00